MNFKILKPWYHTQSQLHKFFHATSDRCWRSQEERGTLLHIFWSCTRLKRFWNEIRLIVQKFTERQIPSDPDFLLLHASSIPGKAYKKSVICHLLGAAKVSIPLWGKTPQPPSIGLWSWKVEEAKWKILCSRHDTRMNQPKPKYTKTWTLWTMFVFSDEGQALVNQDTMDWIFFSMMRCQTRMELTMSFTCQLCTTLSAPPYPLPPFFPFMCLTFVFPFHCLFAFLEKGTHFRDSSKMNTMTSFALVPPYTWEVITFGCSTYRCIEYIVQNLF